MKPGDHPDFFRLPPPPGASRESTIRLDRDGRFWHDGQLVEHPGMARAFASWIRRHPDDGRYILSNGFDWTYFDVEDAPFFVRGIRKQDDAMAPMLELSDASVELLDPTELWVGERDALYTRVKAGQYVARFTPAAQTALAPWLSDGSDGSIEFVAGRVAHRIVHRSPG
jgi:hypothetical protein